MASETVQAPTRIDGPTPAGGAYTLVYEHPDGAVEIVEFDAADAEIARTYSAPPAAED